jgi:hypothetical protein
VEAEGVIVDRDYLASDFEAGCANEVDSSATDFLQFSNNPDGGPEDAFLCLTS